MDEYGIIHLELLKMRLDGRVWASCPKCSMPLDKMDDGVYCDGCGEIDKLDVIWHRVNIENLS